MATLQEEEDLKLAAQKQMDEIIHQKVIELIVNGQPDMGAQLLIELARTKLPDSHPSKSLTNGTLLGEQASQLNSFEEDSHIKRLTAHFSHAVFTGGLRPELEKQGLNNEQMNEKALRVAVFTLENLATHLIANHSGIVPSLTSFLLKIKQERGYIPRPEEQVSDAPE